MTLAYLKHEWNGVLDIFEFIGKALYQVFEKTLLVLVVIQAVVVGPVVFAVSLASTLLLVWVWFPVLAAIAAIAPLALLYDSPWDEKDLVRLVIWWAVVALCVFAWSFTVP